MPITDNAEETLLGELARINRKLDDLASEKRSLERLIVRMRRENMASNEVSRKNSAGRMLVESAVIKALSQARGKSVTVSDLRIAAEDVEFRLKESTFRSHLHRMKLRGLIVPADYGRWKLPTNEFGSKSSTDL